jgi:ribose transport system ATP-binding protein
MSRTAGGGGGDRRPRHGAAGRDGRAELPDGGYLEGRDHRGDDRSGVADAYPQRPAAGTAPGREVTLEVGRPLGRAGRDVAFSLRRGEILGIAGLEGAGQSDILRAFWAILRPRRGRVRWAVSPVRGRPPRAGRRGIAYVPRERRREGLMLGRGIAPNVVLPHLGGSAAGPVVAGPGRTRGGGDTRRRGAAEIRPAGAERGDAVGRKPAEGRLRPRRGGTPRLALLDEPTRGVDVGARADIYAMIRRLSSAGTSVVMASSDLPELIGHVRPDRDPERRTAGRDRGGRGPDPARLLVDDLWRPTVEAVA